MSKMGVSDPTCPICGRSVESAIHTFRDCPAAMQFWTNIIPLGITNDFLQVELTDWVNLNLNTTGNVDSSWSDFWAIACHCLWTWRNKETHDDSFHRPLNVIQYA